MPSTHADGGVYDDAAHRHGEAQGASRTAGGGGVHIGIETFHCANAITNLFANQRFAR